MLLILMTCQQASSARRCPAVLRRLERCVSIVNWELNDKPHNVVIHVVKELNEYVLCVCVCVLNKHRIVCADIFMIVDV
jgi:hypothetical protein